MSSRLRVPVATYRLQLNKDFGFKQAAALVSYLNRLGVSDIYASPVLKAREDSTHGYDVIDPTRLNPELGPVKDFDALVESLSQNNMGLLLDIVPNHMAASPQNPWWRDVTERGRESPFFSFFDINWLDFTGSSGEIINHRRFFDIGDFVGIRVEDPPVFDATHSHILRLIEEGKITGLRIDHIDGLYDPLEYLQRLQQRISSSGKGPGFYIVVEKILSGDEALPQDWPVNGTTGYDFASILNALFVDSEGVKVLKDKYAQAIGSRQPFSNLVYKKKKQVMLELFREEMEGLGQYLACLSGRLDADEAGRVITELTACLPVYRTYMRTAEVTLRDRKYLENAFHGVDRHNTGLNKTLDFLKQVLSLDFPADIGIQEKTEWMNFVMRWQQLTGAVMAKGFEDTVLYNYNCLVSLNEVGSSPDAAGLSVDDFHNWNLNRMKHWPHALNATSTHDTKRSEDVRARINVLSEIPGEWEEHLNKWRGWNWERKFKSGELEYPETNTEILLYQTLIGAWPLHRSEVPEFKKRLKAYMIKAAREAKAVTSWIKINQEYENSLLGFMDSILEDSTDNIFLLDFLEFQKKIAFYGALNSLSQVLLKITSPGVPDFYQGMELWDFSLVDPDNRRSIDFNKRQKLLDAMMRVKPAIDDMLASWQDGRIKLYIAYKALNTRRSNRELFQKGGYIPLQVNGKRREHVCAFIRCYRDTWALVAVPRFFTELTSVDSLPVGKQVWGNDRILLPGDSLGNWFNVFTGETIPVEKNVDLAELFNKFPVALLIRSV